MMREAQNRDPVPTRLDGPVALAVAALVAATVLASVFLPAAAPAPRLGPSDDPACREWTDGCRVCQRSEKGASCSLPGIACTTSTPECLDRR